MYDFCLPDNNEEELAGEYYKNKIKNKKNKKAT